MTIQVKLFATLRLALGRGEVSVEADDGTTVATLIDLVGREVGSDVRPWLLDNNGEILTGTMILLDGINIHHLQGLETPVTTTVSIFPPAGGG